MNYRMIIGILESGHGSVHGISDITGIGKSVEFRSIPTCYGIMFD